MKLSMQVGLSPGHIVLDEDPAPLPQRGTTPQFSAHICCGQMAAWIKMPLGMDVGLSPGNYVLDGDPVPLPQIFGPCLLFLAVLVWRGYMPAPRFTISVLVIIEFRFNILQLRDVTDIICAKNRLQYLHSYRYRKIF